MGSDLVQLSSPLHEVGTGQAWQSQALQRRAHVLLPIGEGPWIQVGGPLVRPPYPATRRGWRAARGWLGWLAIHRLVGAAACCPVANDTDLLLPSLPAMCTRSQRTCARY